jgi:hypothetical protein
VLTQGAYTAQASDSERPFGNPVSIIYGPSVSEAVALQEAIVNSFKLQKGQSLESIPTPGGVIITRNTYCMQALGSLSHQTSTLLCEVGTVGGRWEA